MLLTNKASFIIINTKNGAEKLGRRKFALAIIVIAVLLSTLFLVHEMSVRMNEYSTPKFFVGVEFAYNNVENCKALVDRVKNFTNLFVVGSLETTLDESNLNEVCDYVYDAGLYFFVFFISPMNETMYYRYNYYPHIWILEAKEKYGDRFLGTYAFDEPGGKQLDQGSFKMVIAEDAKDYAEASEVYVENLYAHIEYYTYLRIYEDYRVLTADYGLYWFDYKAGYDTVLAEFGWNHSRQLHVALCRGAARVQNKDWGVIVTWTYNGPPYIESGDELYNDMILAYHAGAKYVVVFNYPKIVRYGILTPEHFDAIKKFWNYIHTSPENHGIEGELAYVLPKDYGFGFRNPNDTIWGLWKADESSKKIWDDVNNLLDRYGSRLDIVYSDPEFNNAIKNRYNELIFWNETAP